MNTEPQKAQIQIGEKEAALIKVTFKGNEELLKSIRALFFGFEVSKAEKDSIRSTFANKELKDLFDKRFCPEVDRNAPIGQISDVWLGVEEMVFGHPKDTVFQAITYKDQAIGMIKTSLNLLDNPDGQSVSIEFNPRKSGLDELGVNLLARNMYIRLVESQLSMFLAISNLEDETPTEQKKRLTKNSTK